MTLSEIIARVEAATGPDRELDAEIGRALGLDVRAEFAEEPDLGDWFIGQPRECGSWMEQDALPDYTASLDAALTLVPKRYGRDLPIHMQRTTSFGCCAVVWHDPEFNRSERGDAGTMPLAVCAASLRARLAMEKSA